MNEKIFEDRKCPICGKTMKMAELPPSPLGSIYVMYGCLDGCGVAWTVDFDKSVCEMLDKTPLELAEEKLPLDRYDEVMLGDELIQDFIEARKEHPDLTARDYFEDKIQYDLTVPWSYRRITG